MSSIKTLEPLVDPCSQIFVKSMTDLAGQRVDLGIWLQWYAFDVIGAITFNKRFGFMESRRDINNVIEGIDFGLSYAGLVGRIPWLHPFLLGNMVLLKLQAVFFPTRPDPIRTVTNVRHCDCRMRRSLTRYHRWSINRSTNTIKTENEIIDCSRTFCHIYDRIKKCQVFKCLTGI
jgi:hypothetical protein